MGSNREWERENGLRINDNQTTDHKIAELNHRQSLTAQRIFLPRIARTHYFRISNAIGLPSPLSLLPSPVFPCPIIFASPFGF